jgi:hypothetical protein
MTSFTLPRELPGEGAHKVFAVRADGPHEGEQA